MRPFRTRVSKTVDLDRSTPVDRESSVLHQRTDAPGESRACPRIVRDDNGVNLDVETTETSQPALTPHSHYAHGARTSGAGARWFARLPEAAHNGAKWRT